MKRRKSGPRPSWFRTLFDMAEILESAQGSDDRIVRVLELLGKLVACECCALLDAQPEEKPRVFAVPAPSPEGEARLRETLTKLYRRLFCEHARAVAGPGPRGWHLAIPLVGLDDLIGILYLRRTSRRYAENDLRMLSLVGAKLAAYLTMLRGRELAELRRAAEAASRAKDDFLATVSHELRTPLTAILGWTQVIKMGIANPQEVAHGAEVIARNVHLQAQLIDDLLDLSRIVTGKLRLNVEPVELARVIAAAVDAVKPACDGKRIRIECALEPLGDVVNGDAGRLQQVFWNLLSNAVKFTPSGGRIEVALKRVESHAELTVSDTGEGIRADFLPHMFERFHQADASAAREHGGLGIGLALVKELTELHGGRVTAASDGEGRGSTFTVHLPVSPVQARKGGPRPDGRHRLGTRIGSDTALLQGIRVLVVDDEPDALDVMQRILESQQAQVTVASSVDGALATLADLRFDVLLSDIGMPRRDGYELISEVRKRGLTTPAAAVTAFARGEDRARALLLGFHTHLPKPVDASELLVTVASLSGRLRR
jgi:signal transduction histidine kinase/CheY-like chemotaxis protein